MTLKQFQEKVTIGTCLMGQIKVIIHYRGKVYSCKSNNTEAYDTIRAWLRWDDIPCGYTPKQAYQAFWDECKQANSLTH